MKHVAALIAAAALAGCVAPSPPGYPAASDAPAMQAASYTEQHRPAFHFTPPTGWMNDPNGLVFHEGEWHMFYQYYPHDTVWGPMHWAHAVSRDQINWETLPIAIAPGEDGYIFSGSAVIDKADSAGFGAGSMVAIYTIHDPLRGAAGTRDHESQGIAWSHDNGRTFQKFAGNPVLANPGNTQDFRDPNVFWDEAHGQWVMALSVTDHVRFYASSDLRDWTYLSSFGEGVGAHDGVWECPNLFPIVDETSGKTRWVLIQNLNPGGPQGGSGTQYFVGDWDGTHFTLDPASAEGPVWLDHGSDNYAGITWGDAPGGRRVFIGWMSNWLYAQQVPTGLWRSAMTVPREVSLHGLELRQEPVRELQALRGDPLAMLQGASPGTLREVSPTAEYDLSFRLPEEGGSIALTFSNEQGEKLSLGLDHGGNWYVDRTEAGNSSFNKQFAAVHTAPRLRTGETTRLHLLMDKTSVEVFADDGATVLTETFFPSSPLTILTLVLSEGTALVDGQAWPLAAADFGP